MGTKPQSIRSVVSSMDHLIGSGEPVVSSLCIINKENQNKDAKGGKSLTASIANILGKRINGRTSKIEYHIRVCLDPCSSQVSKTFRRCLKMHLLGTWDSIP